MKYKVYSAPILIFGEYTHSHLKCNNTLVPCTLYTCTHRLAQGCAVVPTVIFVCGVWGLSTRSLCTGGDESNLIIRLEFIPNLAEQIYQTTNLKINGTCLFLLQIW